MSKDIRWLFATNQKMMESYGLSGKQFLQFMQVNFPRVLTAADGRMLDIMADCWFGALATVVPNVKAGLWQEAHKSIVKYAADKCKSIEIQQRLGFQKIIDAEPDNLKNN